MKRLRYLNSFAASLATIALVGFLAVGCGSSSDDDDDRDNRPREENPEENPDGETACLTEDEQEEMRSFFDGLLWDEETAIYAGELDIETRPDDDEEFDGDGTLTIKKDGDKWSFSGNFVDDDFFDDDDDDDDGDESSEIEFEWEVEIVDGCVRSHGFSADTVIGENRVEFSLRDDSGAVDETYSAPEDGRLRIIQTIYQDNEVFVTNEFDLYTF